MGKIRVCIAAVYALSFAAVGVEAAPFDPAPLGAAVDGAQSLDRSCRHGQRGQLIHFERVASYPTPALARNYFEEWIAFYQDYYQFPAELPVRFRHGFDSYKLAYCTIDAALPGERIGRPTVATGMLSVPRRAGPLSTVIYLHGTSVSFYDAVSNPNIFGEYNEYGESFDGPPSNAIFAGAGFIYIAPDYLGLGDSKVPRHRYFHAQTEASATIDLLAAANTALAALDVERNGDRFVFGFSQGGHAALAVQRALQRAQVEVTATATVGAVFDVERWFLASLANDTTVTLPLYVSYLLLAYDDVYDVYSRRGDVFRAPYARTVDDLFDMQHYFDDVLAGLPGSARELLRPAFHRCITTDAQHAMRVRMRENAVDGWRPLAPVRVYHSRDDEEVPLELALASVERLRSHGANVSVRTFAGHDHVNSWIQAMPRAVAWFRSLETLRE